MRPLVVTGFAMQGAHLPPACEEKQPDPVADGVVRWRCADLKEKIAKRFGVALSERSVGRILNERGFRKLSARPKHPEVHTAAQEAFRQTSPRS
jgi:transposase